MPLKSLAQLTKPLRIALLVMVGAACLSGVVQLLDGLLYSLAYERAPEALVIVAELGVMVVSLLNMAAATVVGVLFLMWLYRANKNLRAATHQQMVNTPEMSVLWFFIPFANFVMPQKVMKEIWYASHLGQVSGHAKVNRLWAIWMTSVAYGIPLSIFMMSATEPSARGMALLAYVGNDVFSIARGLAMLAFVMAVTAAFAANVDETVVMLAGTATGGWHADPAGRHALRFWDGSRWTDWVADGDTQSVDPLPQQ